MEKWVKYVTNDGYDWESEMKLPEHPGPIDNSSLFTSKSKGIHYMQSNVPTFCCLTVWSKSFLYHRSQILKQCYCFNAVDC